MSSTYYPCVAKIQSRKVYFLWFTNDIDGIVLDNDRVLTFLSLKECVEFIHSRGFLLGEEKATIYDFDAVDKWINELECSDIDVKLLLDLWNIIEDFMRTKNSELGNFQLHEMDLYNKLFYANNIPSITPPGHRFNPEWSDIERKKLASILTKPYLELRSSILR